MFRYLITALIIACAGVDCSLASAARPLDERDQLMEAHAYHVMFSTRSEAVTASEILRSTPANAQLTSLRDMARRKTVDIESRSAGGDLGIVRAGQRESGFEELIFSLPLREVSLPVRSQFGWHVLYIDSRTVKPIAQICQDGLRAYAKPADSKLAQALALSKTYKPDENGIATLSKVLGTGWGQPVQDMAGNMRYFKGVPLDEPGVFDVSEHIEYSYATYHAARNACMRSSVSHFIVNCKAGMVAENGVKQYELRGAQGRELAHIARRSDSPVLPFIATDIYEVMHELVCHVSDPAKVAGAVFSVIR